MHTFKYERFIHMKREQQQQKTQEKIAEKEKKNYIFVLMAIQWNCNLKEMQIILGQSPHSRRQHELKYKEMQTNMGLPLLMSVVVYVCGANNTK